MKDQKLNKEDLFNLVNRDVVELINAEKTYGNSWKQRGGVGAFMMLARKWDRIENQVKEHNWDVFKALEKDRDPEGLLDDIRDLRCYLLLVDNFINKP